MKILLQSIVLASGAAGSFGAWLGPSSWYDFTACAAYVPFLCTMQILTMIRAFQLIQGRQYFIMGTGALHEYCLHAIQQQQP